MASEDTRDNLEIIRDALIQFGGPQKPAGSWHMVCCPFHADKTPSCGVVVAAEDPSKIGFFNCLGCNTKGPWNLFAEKAGLPTIKEWNTSAFAMDLATSDLENNLLGESGLTIKHVFKTMGCEEAQRWPVEIDWRSFSGKFIRSVGGHIIDDSYNDSIAVLFPISVGGKIRGGVKAIYERKGKSAAYFTMRGEWASKYGLFPYHYAKHLIDKYEYDFLVVVEGPRDALRLLYHGIPAVAILGATSFSKTKALYVTALAQFIYVIPDNDNGGTTMWNTCKSFLRPMASKVTRIKLPVTYTKKKELIKIDPGNMSDELLDDFIELLIEKHGFKRKKRK